MRATIDKEKRKEPLSFKYLSTQMNSQHGNLRASYKIPICNSGQISQAYYYLISYNSSLLAPWHNAV